MVEIEKDLDKIRDALADALTKLSHKYELNYYELLGLLEIIKRDIHLAAEEQDDDGWKGP